MSQTEMISITTVECTVSSKSAKGISAVVSSTPPHSPLTSSNGLKGIVSEGKTSAVEPLPQDPPIWEWGVDETLWNPDRIRRFSICQDDDDDVLAQEHMDKLHEWLKRDMVMTEAEREQSERAMEAFRKTFKPIDDETLDELMGDSDCCC